MAPWFAYLTLGLLQLKVIWGDWLYRDLPFGDTSSYFVRAYGWYSDFVVNIVWSPLYTAFYGSLLYLSPDVYLITTLHRFIIVFVVTFLVLAVMRQLLPPGLAWLISAWWAILPTYFNILYEVHLFAIIPVLVACWLISFRPTPWARGSAVAVLLTASLLVRNELSSATIILTAICLGWEIWLIKKGDLNFKPLVYVTSYGLPLLLAGIICIFFFMRSGQQFDKLKEVFHNKHTFNMCQIYAFGYQQRHIEWNKNAWTQCSELMQTHFHNPKVTLTDMVLTNPNAVMEHFLWNIRLIPAAIQVLLFNATSDTVNPDYISVQLESSTALALSIIAGLILLTGLVLLCQRWVYWWNFWLQKRAIGWLGLLALAPSILIIGITHRPRPSFILSLGVIFMALIGMSIFIIIHNWNFKRFSGWMPLVMVVVLLTVPNYYATPTHHSPRRWLDIYRKLSPFQEIIAKPDTVFFLKGEYAGEITNYLGYGRPQVFNYDILAESPDVTTSLTSLESKGINLVYVDETLATKIPTIDPFAPSFSTALQSVGWKLIAFQDLPGDRWMLWQKIQ